MSVLDPAIDERSGRIADNKAFIRYFVDHALNAKELHLADVYFSSAYMVHIPGRPDSPPGPSAFKNVMAMWHRAFPDWCMTIDDLLAEGDKVVNRFTTVGTHTGPLLSWGPTGRRFEVHGVVVHRFQDGLVAETWVSDDLPGMLAQLGLLVPAGPSSAAPQQGEPFHGQDAH
jgi:predicted ester cyclase